MYVLININLSPSTTFTASYGFDFIVWCRETPWNYCYGIKDEMLLIIVNTKLHAGLCKDNARLDCQNEPTAHDVLPPAESLWMDVQSGRFHITKIPIPEKQMFIALGMECNPYGEPINGRVVREVSRHQDSHPRKVDVHSSGNGMQPLRRVY